jgi:hypothetical protein
MTDGFDWNSDDRCIVLRRRYATAIYINADGDITLRQEQWPEDDVYIVIPVEDGEYFGSMVAAVARAGASGECAMRAQGVRPEAAPGAEQPAELDLSGSASK